MFYRGTNLWKPVGGRAVFGGQVVGQALVAAGKTKPNNVHLHSMHCYFIRPGIMRHIHAFGVVIQRIRIAPPVTSVSTYCTVNHGHEHVCHYFIGNPDFPILYHVEINRDGRSFCSRTVKAVQNGDVILTMMASYHKVESLPMENQFTMPVVPLPSELTSLDSLMKMALRYSSTHEAFQLEGY